MQLGTGRSLRSCPVQASYKSSCPGFRRAPASRSRRKLTVNAVFEKFTERSIKSVMIAQQEAKNMGAGEVLAGSSYVSETATPRVPF